MSASVSAIRLILMLCISGCAASPETKLASSQYKAALNAYTQDLRSFEDAWTMQVDRLRGDLGAALTAHSVAARVGRLSAAHDGYSSRTWQRKVATGGLIDLSAAIDDERTRVIELLETLDEIPLEEVFDPMAAVDAVLAEYRRLSIAAIHAGPVLSADEKQRLLEEVGLGPFGADAVANSIVRTYISWRVARDAIPRDIDNLEAILNALRKAHASVDRWIQTDVTVPGDDIATLVQEWSVAVGAGQ